MEIKEIIWLFSGLAAWVAFGLGIVNFFRVSKIEKTKLYLDLRGRYLEVRQQVPDRYFGSTEIVTEANPDWLHIERYWYQSFDEWFTTKKLGNSEYSDLWDSYFQPAIKSTLKYKSMRTVLVHMLNGAVSFGAQKDEFHAVMNSMWHDIEPKNNGEITKSC